MRRSLRLTLPSAMLLVFFMVGLVLHPAPVRAQASSYTNIQGAIFPNYQYKPTLTAPTSNGLFTATSQTGQSVHLPGLSYATILVKGTALTTVTFATQGSNDGGTTWFPLLMAAVAVPGTTATTETATASALYICNVSGMTNIRFVTSGTFTATSVTILVTASANKGLL